MFLVNAGPAWSKRDNFACYFPVCRDIGVETSSIWTGPSVNYASWLPEFIAYIGRLAISPSQFVPQ